MKYNAEITLIYDSKSFETCSCDEQFEANSIKEAIEKFKSILPSLMTQDEDAWGGNLSVYSNNSDESVPVLFAKLKRDSDKLSVLTKI